MSSYRASSYYGSNYDGSVPGSPDSSLSRSLCSPISSPSISPTSLHGPSDLSAPPPPAPLKVAHTRASRPATSIEAPPNAYFVGRDQIPRGQSPHSGRSASPYGEWKAPSSAPNAVLSSAPYQRSPALRGLTSLPENLEIALPPGVPAPSMQRPGTPVEQLEFHVSRKGSLSEAYNVIESAPPSRIQTPVNGQTPLREITTPWEPQLQSSNSSDRSVSRRTYAGYDWERVPTPAPALSTLWNAAQGAHPMPGDGGISILNMYRQMPLTTPNMTNAIDCSEHFTFGPSISQPFYTLRAQQLSPLPQSLNELSLSRRSPLALSPSSAEKEPDMKVLNMQLQPTIPTDGLVTIIYPKRAVLSAIARSPNPHTPTKDAIRAAAETECCKLTYSASRRRYELHHPAVVTRSGEAALIVKIAGDVGFDNMGARGTIKLVNTTSQETLAAVDFANGSRLLVNTNATSKIESPYIVDVAVGVVLVVAAVEGRKVRAAAAESASRATSSAAGWSEKHSVKVGSRRGSPGAGPSGGPGRWVVLFVKGVGWVLWFIPMLGWEIGKAIVLAFRDPDKPSKGSKNSRAAKDGKSHAKERRPRRKSSAYSIHGAFGS